MNAIDEGARVVDALSLQQWDHKAHSKAAQRIAARHGFLAARDCASVLIKRAAKVFTVDHMQCCHNMPRAIADAPQALRKNVDEEDKKTYGQLMEGVVSPTR